MVDQREHKLMIQLGDDCVLGRSNAPDFSQRVVGALEKLSNTDGVSGRVVDLDREEVVADISPLPKQARVQMGVRVALGARVSDERWEQIFGGTKFKGNSGTD